MLVFVPLMFGMVWLAKVLDIQASAHDAARGMAFECAQANEQCARLMNDPELTSRWRQRYVAGASDQVGANAPRHDAWWRDRQGVALLNPYADPELKLTPERFSSPLAFASGQSDGARSDAVQMLSNQAGPGRFGLDIQGGLFRARVQVPIARDATWSMWYQRLTAMPLRAQSQLAILADTWSAGRPDGPALNSVATRVRAGARLPGGLEWPLSAAWMPVRAELRTAQWLGFESRAEAFRWHDIDVDLVPPDRLNRVPKTR